MTNKTEYDRRTAVSFDAFYFEKQRIHGKSFSMQETFSHIADINLWGSSESVSGVGSTDIETRQLKKNLILLLAELKIHTLLDAACGDFQWLNTVDLPIEQYYGVDIDRQHIERLIKTFHNTKQFFSIADICKDALPRADLILCRDCLVHFSFDDIHNAINNFKKSGARYLLTTTFVSCNENADIVTGDWRTLNLQCAPFSFPKPIQVITEGCKQNNGLYADKSLALWELDAVQ